MHIDNDKIVKYVSPVIKDPIITEDFLISTTDKMIEVYGFKPGSSFSFCYRLENENNHSDDTFRVFTNETSTLYKLTENDGGDPYPMNPDDSWSFIIATYTASVIDLDLYKDASLLYLFK